MHGCYLYGYKEVFWFNYIDETKKKARMVDSSFTWITVFPKKYNWKEVQANTLFHLTGNSQTYNTDHLYKVRPLLDHFILKFKPLYIPKQQLSLEAMTPWRGHIRFKMYNPPKIMKNGILARMLCASVPHQHGQEWTWVGRWRVRKDRQENESWVSAGHCPDGELATVPWTT